MSEPARAEPRITIGITCHGEGEWLRECWESVLAQTDDRWVAVLVMDGTDHEPTRKVFAELEHPKLRKVALPANAGPYPTRNKAFELTETPLHFYLDGDDQLLPGSVAAVLDAFDRHPDAGYVYGDYECFGGVHEIRRYRREVTWDVLARGQPTPGPCAYQTRLWRELGGYAPELARGNGDYDLLIGAAEAGWTGRHCGRVFYRYRVGHSTKVSSSYDLRYHETHEIMVRRHPRFFRSPIRRMRFLAAGYRWSALATAKAGDLDRAAGLAFAAIRRGAVDRELWGILERRARRLGRDLLGRLAGE